MDITGVNSNMSVPVAETLRIPPETAAENRSLVQAVKALNGTEMFGQDNHLSFQRDPYSKRMVLQVVNGKTHEVVLQLPSEEVLRMAENLK
jgi:flagellar protein FlaG